MNIFPYMMYRVGGPCAMPGGTFSHMVVTDDSEMLTAMTDGWFASLPEAITASDQDSALAVQEINVTRRRK